MKQGMNIPRKIARLFEPVARRVRNMIGRAVIASIDDSQGIQLLKAKVLAGETRDKVEHFQSYGFTSHPPVNSEAIVAFPNGDRGHGIALLVDNRASRKKNLAEGESAIYTKFGDFIHLKADGTMEIIASSAVDVTAPEVNVNASSKCTVTAPETEVTGNLTVGGNCLVTGLVTGTAGVLTLATGGGGTTMESIVDTYNAHTHDENGDGGGTTDAPNQSI